MLHKLLDSNPIQCSADARKALWDGLQHDFKPCHKLKPPLVQIVQGEVFVLQSDIEAVVAFIAIQTKLLIACQSDPIGTRYFTAAITGVGIK